MIPSWGTDTVFIYEAFIEHLVRASPGARPSNMDMSQPCPRAEISCSERDKNWGGDTVGRRWERARRDLAARSQTEAKKVVGGGGGGVDSKDVYGRGKDFLNRARIAPTI